MIFLEYYFKKFWYLFILVLLILIMCVMVYINRGTLISYFEEYNNKVSLNPEEYTEEYIDDIDSYLEDLHVGHISYITKDSDEVYIPSNEDPLLFKENLKLDKDYYYRKEISWANSSLTTENYNELVELIGYHLNKNQNNSIVIVRPPTTEELNSISKNILYETDSNGVLYLTLHVEEINSSTSISKVYFYTFKLKHNMYGKIDIN